MANSKKIFYLVGTYWYSIDQGDNPNVAEFPSGYFETLGEAQKEYERLERYNRQWYYGFQKAYLVEARNGNFKLLKGYLPI